MEPSGAAGLKGRLLLLTLTYYASLATDTVNNPSANAIFLRTRSLIFTDLQNSCSSLLIMRSRARVETRR